MKLFKGQAGATTVSYGLLIGLIAVGLLGTLSAVGGSLSGLFLGTGNSLEASVPEEPLAPGCGGAGLSEATAQILNDWTGAMPDYTASEWCNVTTINESNQGHTTIPVEVGQLTSLRNFHAMGNQITFLPDELQNLTDLSRILVTNNQLQTLPAWLADLPNLTMIHATYNSFSSLPAEICALRAGSSVSVYIDGGVCP